MPRWTTAAISDLHGKVALVTGANSGLGLETTRALAAKGAQVIMACRNQEKAQAALDNILSALPQAVIEMTSLDLASLASVRECAALVSQKHPRLDFLFNNAGVMAIPHKETVDGFEVQVATNYLGHFALTGLLLPTLLNTPQSRIVTLTSVLRVIAFGRIDFADLYVKRSYNRWKAYGRSKLADLLFACELQRCLARAGSSTISVAAHPGYARTELQLTSSKANKSLLSLLEHVGHHTAGQLMSQSAAMGALPELYAAISPDVHGGELIGPDRFFGLAGYPHIEANHEGKRESVTATQLWDLSVDLTGVDFASLHETQNAL